MTPTRLIVLHPSYGRPGLGVAAANDAISKISGLNTVEYRIGLQTNDPAMSRYYDESADPVIQFSLSDGPDQVGNLNSLFSSLDEPDDSLVIYNSDDIVFPDRWDELLLRAVKDSPRCAGGKYVVMVSDGHHRDRLQIVCIASFGYLKDQGYFHYPGYVHMYGDTEFTEVAYLRQANIEARHIVMLHNHPDYGTGVRDATYEKGKNTWQADKAMFDSRSAAGFPAIVRASVEK